MFFLGDVPKGERLKAILEKAMASPVLDASEQKQAITKAAEAAKMLNQAASAEKKRKRDLDLANLRAELAKLRRQVGKKPGGGA